ncbi:hypothetical protein HAX54_041782 [Datura stramonium]|uniref:Putative plant transposon protein domain-containing protein n=1 Tax=Datura stramonium TaxID=4076 RepID=A0ABS8SLJ8_DATST|nr:hypothetical protein [Datura stramonium]
MASRRPSSIRPGARRRHNAARPGAMRRRGTTMNGVTRREDEAVILTSQQTCATIAAMRINDRLLTLGLGFVFDAPSECNLNMVREFFAYWMPKESSNQVKIRGQIIEFAPIALNRLLGTPHVDPQNFIDMVKKPPYRDIRHTLCDPNSLSRWTCHQQCGYHIYLPYAHLSREAQVWLKIVCACLVPGKHVTLMTRERMCIVYALMTGMSINMGVINKNVLKRERVKKGQNFGFRGLLNRFLWGHDIEEKQADYRPAYDPWGIDMTKT